MIYIELGKVKGHGEAILLTRGVKKVECKGLIKIECL
jgi:hypothetical protein